MQPPTNIEVADLDRQTDETIAILSGLLDAPTCGAERLLDAIVDPSPPLALDAASYAIAQALEDDVAAVESGTADERADRRDFQNVPPQYGEDC